MKVLSTEGLTKLIELTKGSFISVDDTVSTNSVTLATVATSGSYNDLSNKPTIPDTSNLANKDLSNLSSTGEAHFQTPLVSGTNIKTINNTSLLGNGNISVLQNTASSNTSLEILGDTGSYSNAISIGDHSSVTGNYGTAIGKFAESAEYSIALGEYAISTAEEAYQIGNGTNSTAYSLCVGFYNSGQSQAIGNYKLLDGTTGLIPDARISANIARSDLNNLSATGKTVIDGQWVNTSQDIISSNTSLNGSSVLTYRISVLPNDGHKYEVLIRGRVVTGSTSGNYLYLQAHGNELSGTTQICGCQTRSSSSVTAVGSGIIIASYVPSGSTNLTISRSSNWTGNMVSLSVYAYRRIGTNS